MIYLFLSILLNVAIFLAFRTFGPWRIRVFQAVVFNYIVCSVLGMLFLQSSLEHIWPPTEPWQWIGILLGFIFIGTFYLLGLTTRHFGITIATISSKMSLVVPVIFGLYVFKIASRSFDAWNYTGVVLALAAVVFSAVKRPVGEKNPASQRWQALLPVSLFLMAGALDTLLNYTNYHFLNPELEVAFIWSIFTTAALIGVGVLLLRREKIQGRSLAGGLYLGLPNFFSMYYILKALSAFDNNGAILFPIFNVGIITLSSLAAVTIFRERLLTINKFGILLAVISVILLSHRELILWLF